MSGSRNRNRRGAPRANAAILFAVVGALACALVIDVRAVSAQPECDDAAEKKAKANFELAEAQKKLEAYSEAVEGYLQAFALCPRPFLLFNAGQAYWLHAEKADRSGDTKLVRTLQVKALVQYKRYIEADPEGKGASLAREQFYEVAEAIFDDGRMDDATRYFKLYLELAPKGKKRAEARARLDAIAAEREAKRLAEKQAREQQEARAEAQRRVQAAPDPIAPDPVGRSDHGRTPTGYRIGFYTTASVTALSLLIAGVTYSQVRGSLKDDQLAAINEYQLASGMQLDIDDACNDAKVKGAQAVIDACDKGKSRMTLSHAFQGVALVSAAAAGFFLYKGFIQKRGAASTTATSALQPTLTPRTVGARLIMRF